MEIELLTAKKKLSKSILNQMPIATFNMDVLNNGDALGYLTNAVRGHSKVIFMKRLEEYYIVHTGWNRDEDDSRSVSVRGTIYKNIFGSEEHRDSWYKIYNKILRETKNHIYI